MRPSVRGCGVASTHEAFAVPPVDGEVRAAVGTRDTRAIGTRVTGHTGTSAHLNKNEVSKNERRRLDRERPGA